MPSSLKGNQDSPLRIETSEDAVVFPEHAEPTDESPTIISKTPPLVESPNQQKSSVKDLARAAMSLETLAVSLRGTKLAHYELIEPIGSGGMAAVIRARDTQLDRFVALKILPPEMAQDIENVQRFHQEAKAAAKLDHENIARVFFCGHDLGLHFIAFEFVEGINLRILLERRGKLPVGEAIRYVLQVATGLEHAATRGVVHRDVKPSNIIISSNGRAKLVDMGLARNLERHGERDLTQSGVTLGTFDYISPEQALEPREADSRSDVYSLGCTLYHMLTGHPSVPEGTPAKKLQHHQHVAPLDPRQDNPTIPDEVVLVLGKMMAKNPKDRYQRPIHLVHHLMQVAQRVGAADDVPEGVHFVDSPLPDPSRSRPFLVIGMALAALVVVILLLSFAPGPSQPNLPTVSPVDVGDRNVTVPDLAKKQGPIRVKEQNAEPRLAEANVKNAADLQAVLSDRSAKEIKAKIFTDDKIDLKDTGLTYRGAPDQRLELESSDPNKHARLCFQYRKSGSSAGLALEGGEIVFKRIKFEFDFDATPAEAVAAVLVRGTRRVVFDQCIFSQEKVPALSSDQIPMASLLIDAFEGSERSGPIVILRDCLFDSNSKTGGQVAVALNGPVALSATSCAFEPHRAFFHFRGESKLPETDIQLKNCAGFVVQGPVFSFEEKSSAKINVEQSVFSNPNKSVYPQAELIILAGNSSVQYRGRKNIYHNLNALIDRKNSRLFLTGAEEFQKYLAQTKGSDQDSVYLMNANDSSPLQNAQPLDRIDDLAFQLKPEYHREIGLTTTWLMRKMPDPPGFPLLAKTNPVPAKSKTVDAEDGGKTPGIFRNLAAALGDAVDGDVILIRHAAANQEVVVAPIILRPGISVTIKPDEGFQPILILDKAFSAEKDTYLFKVQAGKLTLEQLEIRLDPGQSAFDAQSIVQLGETAQCAFKNCVLTLKTTNGIPLNVVTFLDTDKMMKAEVSTAAPARVEFQECFVRGRGDLVSLRGCRLLQVEVKRSLIVLSGGSLLDVRASNKVMPMDQGVCWKMERSSIFTAESIFVLRASENGKGLTKTSAKIEGCLLVALASDQPVVFLETTKDEKYLDWDCKQNFYARFDKLRDWKDLYREENSIYDDLTFPKLEDAMPRLWDATPDSFKQSDANERTTGLGVPADVEQRLLPATPAREE